MYIPFVAPTPGVVGISEVLVTVELTGLLEGVTDKVAVDAAV